MVICDNQIRLSAQETKIFKDITGVNPKPKTMQELQYFVDQQRDIINRYASIEGKVLGFLLNHYYGEFEKTYHQIQAQIKN